MWGGSLLKYATFKYLTIISDDKILTEQNSGTKLTIVFESSMVTILNLY